MKLIDIRTLSYKEVDNIGVGRFAIAMEKKLAQKYKEGKHGWNTTPGTGWGIEIRGLVALLKDQFKRKELDVVDIAIFCMMIWNRRNPRG